MNGYSNRFFGVDGTLSLTPTGGSKSKRTAGGSDQEERGKGLASVIQGFPDTTTFAKFELSMVPVVKPFVSYAHTTFKLNQPASDAYTVGGYAGFKIVEVSASYERYVQPGQPSQNYFGVGAALKF